MKTIFKIVAKMAMYIRLTFLFVIQLYQRTLSFDHGPMAKIFPFWGCRYHPSCSQYAYEAIRKYGVFKGSWMSFKRILRCHPFSKGGHDPVP